MDCPKCLRHTMDLTDWKPPLGLDPKLRKFRCPKCDTRIYKVPRGFERKQEVKHGNLQKH